MFAGRQALPGVAKDIHPKADKPRHGIARNSRQQAGKSHEGNAKASAPPRQARPRSRCRVAWPVPRAASLQSAAAPSGSRGRGPGGARGRKPRAEAPRRPVRPGAASAAWPRSRCRAVWPCPRAASPRSADASSGSRGRGPCGARGRKPQAEAPRRSVRPGAASAAWPQSRSRVAWLVPRAASLQSAERLPSGSRGRGPGGARGRKPQAEMPRRPVRPSAASAAWPRSRCRVAWPVPRAASPRSADASSGSRGRGPDGARGRKPQADARRRSVRPGAASAARLRSRCGGCIRRSPAAIARGVDGAEQFGEVDVALPRLVPAGPVRDLDVPHPAGMALPDGQRIAMDHLRMIDVELQAQVRGPDLVQDLGRQFETVEEIARHVVAVHRLDGQAGAGVAGAGPFQVLDEGAPRQPALGLAGHHMQVLDPQRPAEAQGAVEIAAKARFVARLGGKAARAASPVRRRRVHQHELHPRRLRGLGQFLDREVIGKQDFHPAKARALCGGEALQHGHFGEQIGQVGGESRHGQGSRGKTVPPECNSIRPFSPGIAASASR